MQSATRTWTDTNKDFVPQATELGALNPTNFGTTVVSSRYADDVLTNRIPNWRSPPRFNTRFIRECP